jgi:hypothetical protein
MKQLLKRNLVFLMLLLFFQCCITETGGMESADKTASYGPSSKEEATRLSDALDAAQESFKRIRGDLNAKIRELNTYIPILCKLKNCLSNVEPAWSLVVRQCDYMKNIADARDKVYAADDELARCRSSAVRGGEGIATAEDAVDKKLEVRIRRGMIDGVFGDKFLEPTVLGALVKDSLQAIKEALPDSKETSIKDKVEICEIPHDDDFERVKSILETKFLDVDLKTLFPIDVSSFFSLKATFIDFLTNALLRYRNGSWCSCPMGTDEKRIELVIRLVNHIVLLQDRKIITKDLVYTSFCSGEMLFDLLVLEPLVINEIFDEVVFNSIDNRHPFKLVSDISSDPVPECDSFRLLKMMVDERKGCALRNVKYNLSEDYIDAVEKGTQEKSDVLVMVDPGAKGLGYSALAHGEFQRLVSSVTPSVVYVLDLNIIEDLSDDRDGYLERDVEEYNRIKRDMRDFLF